MAFELPNLPYNKDALESSNMSAETLEFHYGKHHQGYVNKLNNLVQGTELEGQSLEEIIKATAGDSSKAGIFNNAAQVWNHTFFWYSMKPNGGGNPLGEIASKINSDFGGLDQFKAQFKQAATSQFGSGWAWLVLENGTLKVDKTPNAENPMTQGKTPLLTLDVWEHAYYLDYQNRRGDYVDNFLNHLINWDFVAEKYSQAQ